MNNIEFWGKGLEKFIKPKFKMPLIQANAKCCIGIKTGRELLNSLHGYLPVIVYIHVNLRIIVTGAGLFTLQHLFMLFSLQYMYIIVHIMSMLLKETSQWSPLPAFFICITVKSQRTNTRFLSSETCSLGVHLLHFRLYWCSTHKPKLE